MNTTLPQHPILFFLSVLFLSTSATAQELFRLSERVGSGIDSIERQYFRLFPNVENFESATLRMGNDSTVQISITGQFYDERQDSVLIRNRNDADQLGYLIDNYERLKRKDSLRLLKGFDQSMNVDLSTMQTDPIQLITRSGELYRYPLLSVEDKGVYLWDPATDYDWQNPLHNTRFVKYHDIYHVQTVSHSSLIHGGIVGSGLGLIGGYGYYKSQESIIGSLSMLFGSATIGVLTADLKDYNQVIEGMNVKYREAVEPLSSRASFGDRIPPEILAFETEEGSARYPQSAAYRGSVHPSKHKAMNELRDYQKEPLFSIHLRLLNSLLLPSKMETNAYGSSYNRVYTFIPELSDRVSLQVNWRYSSSFFLALSGSLPLEAVIAPIVNESEVGFTSEYTINLDKIAAFALGSTVNLMERSTTAGLFQASMSATVGGSLMDSRMIVYPFTQDTTAIRYHEKVPMVSAAIDMLGRVWFSNSVSFFNSLGINVYFPFKTYPAKHAIIVREEYSRPRRADINEFKFDPFGSINMQFGLSYHF